MQTRSRIRLSRGPSLMLDFPENGNNLQPWFSYESRILGYVLSSTRRRPSSDRPKLGSNGPTPTQVRAHVQDAACRCTRPACGRAAQAGATQCALGMVHRGPAVHQRVTLSTGIKCAGILLRLIGGTDVVFARSDGGTQSLGQSNGREEMPVR